MVVQSRMQRVLFFVVTSTVLAGTSVVATGQDRGAARPEAEAPSASDTGGEEGGGEGEAGDLVETEEREEGQGKVKVFEFSGLDIAGRLKSPQLLYFLNRLRAEFDRPRLPHRSFMPELVRSTKGKAF